MSAPANDKAARRLRSFERLLAHVRELLSLDFGFVLWDGATVPADLPPDALAIVFADEGVVAAIVRRPNADKLLNLWVTARIWVADGPGWTVNGRSRRSSGHKVALLEVDGQKVTYTKRDLAVGLWPYNLDITPDGKLALTADNGNAAVPTGTWTPCRSSTWKQARCAGERSSRSCKE